MRRCLELAVNARRRGNTPVGALVVLEGAVIAEAEEEVPVGLDPTGHAEILAIRKACGTLRTTNLSSATLYTTAEPCWGCSYIIRQTGLAHVIYGRTSPPVGGATSFYPVLLTTDVPSWGEPPEVTGGVLEEACREVAKRNA
jgi:tRNA(adenine34) deaminase